MSLAPEAEKEEPRHHPDQSLDQHHQSGQHRQAPEAEIPGENDQQVDGQHQVPQGEPDEPESALEEQPDAALVIAAEQKEGTGAAGEGAQDVDRAGH